MITVSTQTESTEEAAPAIEKREASPSRRVGKAGKGRRRLRKRRGRKQKVLQEQLRQAEALRASNLIIEWAKQKREALVKAERIRHLRNRGIVHHSISRRTQPPAISNRPASVDTSYCVSRPRPQKPTVERPKSRQRRWTFRKIYQADMGMPSKATEEGILPKEENLPRKKPAKQAIGYPEKSMHKGVVKRPKKVGKKRRLKAASGHNKQGPTPAENDSSANAGSVTLDQADANTESISAKLLQVDVFEDESEPLWECSSCRFANAANETCCALCGTQYQSAPEAVETPAESKKTLAGSESEYSLDDFEAVDTLAVVGT